MRIVYLADDSHEISILIFYEKKIRVSSAAVIIGALKVKTVEKIW